MVQTCVLEMRCRLFSTLSLHCDFSSYLNVWLLNLTSNDLSCFNRMKIIQSKIKDTQTNFLKLCSQSLFFLFFFFLDSLTHFYNSLIDRPQIYHLSLDVSRWKFSLSMDSHYRYPTTTLYSDGWYLSSSTKNLLLYSFSVTVHTTAVFKQVSMNGAYTNAVSK